MIKKSIVAALFSTLSYSQSIYVANNLVWQNEPYTQEDKSSYDNSVESGKVWKYSSAKEYCANLELDGIDNFRLPTLKELKELSNIDVFSGNLKNWDTWFKDNSKYRVNGVFIKEEFLSNMPSLKGKYTSAGFWSSTSVGKRAYRLRFESGYASLRNLNSTLYVRCVANLDSNESYENIESKTEVQKIIESAKDNKAKEVLPIIPKKIKVAEESDSLSQLKEKIKLKKELIKRTLKLNIEPSDAKVDIENIDRNFYQGIDLIVGEVYNLVISKDGYLTEKISFKLEDDKVMNISLKKRPELQEIDEYNKKVVWLDRDNNLMWQNEPYSKDDKSYYDNRQEAGKVWSWEGAKKYCENLVLANYMDWRLPNIEQMETIITRNRNKKFFIKEQLIDSMPPLEGEYDSVTFWTSKEKDSSNAYYTIFELGLINWFAKSDNYYVRCVRMLDEN